MHRDRAGDIARGPRRPQLLVTTFENAAEQLMGTLTPAGKAQEFLSEYRADELHNAQLPIEGLPSAALDPTAEATAFINKHDQAAVMAAGVAQWGQFLNCMISSGAPGCQSSSVPERLGHGSQRCRFARRARDFSSLPCDVGEKKLRSALTKTRSPSGGTPTVDGGSPPPYLTAAKPCAHR